MFTLEGPHIVMSRTVAQNGLDFHFKQPYILIGFSTLTPSLRTYHPGVHSSTRSSYHFNCGKTNTTEKRLRMRGHKKDGEEFKYQIVNKYMAI